MSGTERDPAEHGIGISAVGIAVLDPFGRPVAVSNPAPNHRFNEQREALSQALLAFREMLGTFVGRR
jgi:DNA-binding IclR family transcriptional regulator